MSHNRIFRMSGKFFSSPVQEAFCYYDRDKNGKLSFEEVKLAVYSLGIAPSNAEFERVVSPGGVTIDGLVAVCEKLTTRNLLDVSSVKYEQLESAFGVLNDRTLVKCLSSMGEVIPKNDPANFFDLDTNISPKTISQKMALDDFLKRAMPN